jgi:hypothetical protein
MARGGHTRKNEGVAESEQIREAPHVVLLRPPDR